MMTLPEFCAELQRICGESLHHGFVVQVNASPNEGGYIDVTLPDGWAMKPNCIGRVHQFIFQPGGEAMSNSGRRKQRIKRAKAVRRG